MFLCTANNVNDGYMLQPGGAAYPGEPGDPQPGHPAVAAHTLHCLRLLPPLPLTIQGQVVISGNPVIRPPKKS